MLRQYIPLIAVVVFILIGVVCAIWWRRKQDKRLADEAAEAARERNRQIIEDDKDAEWNAAIHDLYKDIGRDDDDDRVRG